VAVILVIGIGLMIVAPLLRRFRAASPALAAGATAVILLALFGLVHPDSRQGQAAVESNRHFYFLFLGCEFPVLILALVSARNYRWAFWTGWAINLCLALYLTVIVIWLEYFWHW
jgi:hypothetical protein